MANEERDCAAEWECRFTHDRRLIREWQAAIDEVRRFNAEEEKRKQREVELAEGEEEAPPASCSVARGRLIRRLGC